MLGPRGHDNDARRDRRKLAELRREHRRLDEDIAIAPANLDDELQLKRLKKRKLQLKDCIARLEAR
jgi:hypothetical protein